METWTKVYTPVAGSLWPSAATGTSIFVSAIISAFMLRVGPGLFFRTSGETLRELRWPIITIGLVLGFAFIANYSGISSTLGLPSQPPEPSFPSSRRFWAGWAFS